jgi:hypothetical protein
MYGLANREALAKAKEKRQSSGSYKTSDLSRSQTSSRTSKSAANARTAPQLVTSRRSPISEDTEISDDEIIVPGNIKYIKKPVRKAALTEPASEWNDFRRMFDELVSKYTKFEKEMELVNQKYDMVLVKLTQLESSSKNSDATTLGHISEIRPVRKVVLPEPSSMFSALTELDAQIVGKKVINKKAVQEFIPFFVKDGFITKNNKTQLSNDDMNMMVVMDGQYHGDLQIYPFGYDKTLPKYVEMTLNMVFRDSSMKDDGTAYGSFKRRTDGVYVIELTQMYDDNGEQIEMDDYKPPLTLTCKISLVPE